MIENYKHNLFNYQRKQIRSRLIENNLKKEANNHYISVFSGFEHITNIYFNSLKFLRHNWYNYEAEITI